MKEETFNQHCERIYSGDKDTQLHQEFALNVMGKEYLATFKHDITAGKIYTITNIESISVNGDVAYVFLLYNFQRIWAPSGLAEYFKKKRDYSFYYFRLNNCNEYDVI